MTGSTARLEARITPDLHALLKRAATLQGRSMTDFVITAVQEAALKAIQENDLIRLTLEDQIFFEATLKNPPKPNPALKKAFKKHSVTIKK